MNFESYAEKSLELHLFFARIMKEHSLFLKAGLTPVNKNFAEKADFFRIEFEKLLYQAVGLSNGVVSREVLCSGEIVTEFTTMAEKQTECFTGIPINKEITRKEKYLDCGSSDMRISRDILSRVRCMNRRALNLLDGLIALKENILKNVLCCNMFTGNYPLLLEHIIREAKMYRTVLCSLERDGMTAMENSDDTECFWNQIMMEHALFMRGLLDPTQTELINEANIFAADYSDLIEGCPYSPRQGDSLSETVKFRDFKESGAKGIISCEIRSIILPLLADHVLREANHYIRLLEE